MPTASSRRRVRQRGEIETLPSGSLRVPVTAGRDKVSKRRHYLTEVIPAGPLAEDEAEKALRRLLVQVDEKLSPRTAATVAQLLEKHFALLQVERTTMVTYQTSLAPRRPVALVVPSSHRTADDPVGEGVAHRGEPEHALAGDDACPVPKADRSVVAAPPPWAAASACRDTAAPTVPSDRGDATRLTRGKKSNTNSTLG
ncbi:hypothetical protein ACL02T_06500 [Pseudonocardia sp. RS010]|uniref:hypothetical protein n=1 Tax=Pseudonocardia sp. RS010 TaxID=3385979 RepID=UPI0039A10CD3